MAVLTANGVIAMKWVLIAMTFAFIGLRLAVRVIYKQLHLWVSDIWLVCGGFSAMGMVICDTLNQQWRSSTASNSAIVLGKVRLATNYFFDFGMYFGKFSILAFYFHLIPSTLPRLRIFLYLVTGLTVCCSMTSFFVDTFWCGPNVALLWQSDPSCSAFNSMQLVSINWSMNFVTEVLIFIIPFFILPLIGKNRHKTQSGRQKRKTQIIGLTFMFGLGTITLAVSVARFANMVISQASSSNSTSHKSMFPSPSPQSVQRRAPAIASAKDLLATAEYATALTIVSLTALRPLLRAILRRTSSSFSSNKSSGTGDLGGGNTYDMRKSRAIAKAYRNRGERIPDSASEAQGGTLTSYGGITKTVQFGSVSEKASGKRLEKGLVAEIV